MKKLKIIFYILLFACGWLLVPGAFCQDIHFTQFNYSPLTLNPANTGLFHGDYRICINDRNQWKTVSKPFTTLSASFDAKLLTNSFNKSMLSAGIVFFRDKAGDSDFGTSEAALTLSYTKSIDEASRHFLTLGIEGGMAQRTIDFSSLTFDNQFDGFVYDPNLSSLEQFNKTNFSYPDFSAGINWMFLIKKYTHLNAGFSVYHLNSPDQSMLEAGEETKIAPRFGFNSNFVTPIAEKFDIEPAVMFLRQGTYSEINFGAMFRFVMNRDIFNYTSFNLGVYTRFNDAANITAGLDYKRLTLGFSYDINYSELHKASYSQGAYEIAIIYRIFKAYKPYTDLTPHCRIL